MLGNGTRWRLPLAGSNEVPSRWTKWGETQVAQRGRPGRRIHVASPRRALVSLIVVAAVAIGIEPGLSQASSNARALATEARTTAHAHTHARSSDPTATLTTEFHFTGERQSWTAPLVVTEATVESWGAVGGSSQSAHQNPGPGGYAKATVRVPAGETLYVIVGGTGLGGGGETAYGGGSSGVYLNTWPTSTKDVVAIAGGGGGAGSDLLGSDGGGGGDGSGEASKGGGGCSPQSGCGGGYGTGGSGQSHAPTKISDGHDGLGGNGSSFSIDGGGWGGGFSGSGGAETSGGGGGGGGYGGGGGGTCTTGLSCGGGGGGGSYPTDSAAGPQNTGQFGSQNGFVTITVPVGPAKTLSVDSEKSMSAGAPSDLTVTAKDAAGLRATGYRGTIHFTGATSDATLPANYAFSAADRGTHTFHSEVRLVKAGEASITATDISDPSVKGTEDGIHVTPGPLSAMTITPTTMHAETSTEFTAHGFDKFGNSIGDVSSEATFQMLPELGCAKATGSGTPDNRWCTARLVDASQPYHIVTAAVPEGPYAHVFAQQHVTVVSKGR